MFEEQVREITQAIAAIDASQSINYCNQKANQFAHYLISQGMTSQDLVAIYLNQKYSSFSQHVRLFKSWGEYIPY